MFLFKDASFESDITTEKVRGLKQIKWCRHLVLPVMYHKLRLMK
ncbi:hypothetical protein HanRHA438_Chr16g0756041 [Helianthus annuus]|uniref:Uncharacterized protein n=1 Tax=Helianthus annuus TaxID=4232 RepID=A0A9K3DRG3_HELAN|nr:hypothetical protein HanXRQr2_Chr16g0744211 [Helianthus annuus]KAJ0437841.1 hypothetical protein HanHA300_Chr16g0606871 [Helianthus annuus]KAJ0442407.1 hypothetical protein HanIR_Chr16g0808891 [Helianthus annuus]KAJ0460166.1 hypothetical protein HanHA89_Chr16g0657471 [Helianthus annuus]KAJ0644533.1 hypothetical protein HanOQP8_Chr16g0613251 [Helianthus annuus]